MTGHGTTPPAPEPADRAGSEPLFGDRSDAVERMDDPMRPIRFRVYRDAAYQPTNEEARLLLSRLSAAEFRLGVASVLADDLIRYSDLRGKVRLREDESEYEEAERLIGRFDRLQEARRGQ